jgi:plastocyanin
MLFSRPLAVAIGALALVLALVASAFGHLVVAQDDEALQDPRYPVAIHQGSCDDPAEQPSFDLGEAALAGILDEGEDQEFRGPGDAVPVIIGNYIIQANYDTLLDEQSHVVAVHRSADEMGDLVACGSLGGVVDAGRLTVGLEPLDDSGVRGVAVLDEDAEGNLGLEDNQIQMYVYILVDIERAMEQTGAQATPEPAPEAPPEEEVVEEQEVDENGTEAIVEEHDLALEMFDIGFDPVELTIQANEDVTVSLNNTGAAMHNFSIDELELSVDVGPGQTHGVTINADPGEYAFYCNVIGHRAAGMEGTLIVEE